MRLFLRFSKLTWLSMLLAHVASCSEGSGHPVSNEATGGFQTDIGSTGGETSEAQGGSSSAGTACSDSGSVAAGGISAGTTETITPKLCGFASGLNVAWVRFGADVPNPDLATFNTIFKNTHDAGGRIIRWWFHTNGTKTPGYDCNGLSLPLQQAHVDGVRAILNAAATNQVGIVISLWSFDMLQSNAGGLYGYNKKLLEDDSARQTYIDNYLTPLVNAIKGTPGLYSWEIFNEPEGMVQNMGWSTYRTTQVAVQKTVNWLADAIHAADPNALVTNGAQTFATCSTTRTNWYSDTALRTVGGREKGILDYYQVHFYASNGANLSPFGRAATVWGLDKTLVIGEFDAAVTNNGVAATDTYTDLYTNGYTGAWAWSYNANSKWPGMQLPMQTLFDGHAEVGNCP